MIPAESLNEIHFCSCIIISNITFKTMHHCTQTFPLLEPADYFFLRFRPLFCIKTAQATHRVHYNHKT
uniref:Uncharacterized protein n=1 Tax=Anguilla anguilla TaxID=7936 RepID=A0A0E9RSB0_ANGAN